jgi:hypothetical protein
VIIMLSYLGGIELPNFNPRKLSHDEESSCNLESIVYLDC